MKLLSIISENGKSTRNDLSEKLKISTSTVSRYLDKLQKLGIIKRDGSKTSGSWIIKKD